MATQGTVKVFGGTPSVRYSEPAVTGSANSLGLYAWSAFRARLGTGSATSFAALASVQDNSVISLLLFTTDILAIGAVVDAGGTAGTPITGLVRPSDSVAFFDATSGGSDLIVPVGKVGQGYVGTVACSGFPATASVTAASTTTDLLVIANGSTISSPVSLQDYGAPSAASGALPVILNATNYTAAIRDAGNQIVTASGVVYQVVGLYAVVAD